MRLEKHLSESTRIGEGVTGEKISLATAKSNISAPDLLAAKTTKLDLTDLAKGVSFADRIKADLASTETIVLPLALVSKPSVFVIKGAPPVSGKPQGMQFTKAAPNVADSVARLDIKHAAGLSAVAPSTKDSQTNASVVNDLPASDPVLALATPASAQEVAALRNLKPFGLVISSGKIKPDALGTAVAVAAVGALHSPWPKQKRVEAADGPPDAPSHAVSVPNLDTSPQVAIPVAVPLVNAPNLPLRPNGMAKALTSRSMVIEAQGKALVKPSFEAPRSALGLTTEPSASNGTPKASAVPVLERTALQNTMGSPWIRSLEGWQHAVAIESGSTLVHPILATGTVRADSPKGEEIMLAATVQSGEPTLRTGAQTLIATPHVVEIGVADGTHGWLRVRAELSKTGDLNGMVLTNSATGASVLRGELTAISNFLQGEAIGLKSLVIQTTGATHGWQSAGQNTASGGQPQRDGQREEQHANARAQSNPARGDPQNAGAWSLPGIDFGRTPSVAVNLASGLGGWLSVRV